MHKLALKGLIEVVRTRYAEGDCPTHRRPSGETLEDAILDLAAEVDKLSASGIGRMHRLCDFLEQPEWIPLDDCKPDDDESVMTFSPDSCDPVCPGFLDAGIWRQLDGLPMQMTITHWMPYPLPPKSTESV